MGYRIEISNDEPKTYSAQVKRGYFWNNIGKLDKIHCKLKYNSFEDAKIGIQIFHINQLMTMKIKIVKPKNK